MTNYYQCVSCTKTSEQQRCKVTVNDHLIRPHCLDAVEFAFSVCTAAGYLVADIGSETETAHCASDSNWMKEML